MTARAKILVPLLALLALLTLPAVSRAAASFQWNPGVRVEPASLGGLDAVSCPASRFCAAADEHGNVLVSTTPTATHNTWRGARVDADGGAITSISCPSASFCAAVDSLGAFVYSDSPTSASARAWSHPVRIDTAQLPGGGFAGLASISCPSTTLCVAVDNGTDSNVLYTTDPAGGKSAWHAVSLGAQATSVDCPTIKLCVVGGASRWVSTDPTSSSSWTAATAVAGEVYQSVDCVGTYLCVGIGYGNTTPGFAVATKTPARNWSSVYSVESNPPPNGGSLLDTVGCTRGTCVALDGADNAFVTSTPTTGVWGDGAPIRTKSASQWNAVSCSSGICAVVDSAGVETTGILR